LHEERKFLGGGFFFFNRPLNFPLQLVGACNRVPGGILANTHLPNEPTGGLAEKAKNE
jgi:hypothetical protein